MDTETDTDPRTRVEASLAAIDRLDAQLRAFAHVDHAGARAAAASVADSGLTGPVAGWPIGVKDVLDTVDQPTELGSSIYRGRMPGRDAACVALLRAAGAVMVGKTVTCELASFHPGPTRNPHDPARTPGGSSSGSAAAVAAGMVPAAIGTQTAGSIGRPAAFCGVVGYKPTFGLCNRSGLMAFAESLDTIGVLARRVADAGRVAAAMAVRAELDPAGWPASAWPHVRVGLCHTPEWDDAEPAARRAVTRAADRLAGAGCEVVELHPGPAFDDAAEAQATIMAAEGCQALASERLRHRDALSGELVALLDRGAATGPGEVDHARWIAAHAATELAAAFDRVDVILTPASTGEAPRGLGSTGDPRFNRRWTLLGAPSLSLPAGTGPDGLPVGVQLIGPRWRDASLLALADHVAAQLPAAPVPPDR